MNYRPLIAAMLVLVCLPAIVLAQNPAGPAIGSQVKNFSLVDQFGKEQKLSVLLADGPVALVVFRSAGWCSHCKDQLVQLQSDMKAIDAAGLQIAGLSYDEAPILKDFSDLKGIEFPLLADPNSKLIEQLGVINKTRKKGTVRYRVAYPMTILIKGDRKVAAVIKGNADGTPHSSKQLIDAWLVEKPPEPEKKSMGFVKVFGNQFVVDGKPIRFKGVAIAAPSKILKDGRWGKKHFEQIKDWGANIVRVPVHPALLRKHGRENYLKLLDDAVRWCSELEIYVIIDWHSIGNLRTQRFEAPEYVTNEQETGEFWDTISRRYAGNATVAFYEIFNEPTIYNGLTGAKLGTCTWAQWKAIIEKNIDVIYANDKNVIPLVSGFDWSYDLREVRKSPIDRAGIGYVAHPYPVKSKPPREAHWEEHFGFLASGYPVFVTETGFSAKGEKAYMVDDGSFRNGILKYLDKKKISWCAWVFDPDWSPALIKNYKYEPTQSGAFFRGAMLRDK